MKKIQVVSRDTTRSAFLSSLCEIICFFRPINDFLCRIDALNVFFLQLKFQTVCQNTAGRKAFRLAIKSRSKQTFLY